MKYFYDKNSNTKGCFIKNYYYVTLYRDFDLSIIIRRMNTGELPVRFNIQTAEVSKRTNTCANHVTVIRRAGIKMKEKRISNRTGNNNEFKKNI